MRYCLLISKYTDRYVQYISDIIHMRPYRINLSPVYNMIIITLKHLEWVHHAQSEYTYNSMQYNNHQENIDSHSLSTFKW